MKIAAVLCWFDEPVELLERCVRSLDGVVDELVAVDGRFEPFPGTAACSPFDQATALTRAASEIELDGIGHTPQWPFESQTAKRDFAMRFAANTRKVDWLLVIDADEYVADCHRQMLRWRLEQTDCDVGEISIENVTGDDHRGVEMRRRRLFRALPGLTVRGSHQGYSVDGRWLDGDRDLVLADGGLEPAADLTFTLWLEHTPRSRGPVRNAAAIAYRHSRARSGER